MTPINEVLVGKFCRFSYSVVYIYKNNFKDSYGVIPIVGVIPTTKTFEYKVYVYKKPKKEWIQIAKKWLDDLYENQHGQTLLNGHRVIVEQEVRLDNLLYIENLDILKSYGI